MRFLLIFCFWWMSIGAVPADVFIVEEKQLIPTQDIIQGPYVSFSSIIEIVGKVQGSVYLAGTQVVIAGEVEGDVFVTGASVSISGKVRGDVVAGAGQVTISGSIDGNLVVGGANVQILSQAQIQGKTTLLAGYSDVEGVLQGKLLAIVGGMGIGGKVLGGVQGFVGKLRFTHTAHVEGGVAYRSTYPAAVDPRSCIQGPVVYRPSLVRRFMDLPFFHNAVMGTKYVTLLMNFCYTLGVGFLLLRFFPRKLHAAVHALSLHPWRSFFCGFLLVVLLPVLSALLLITVVGTPFALTLIALNVISFYSVKIFVILWASLCIFRFLHLPLQEGWALLVGLCLYYAVYSIPVVGWLVAFLSLLCGLGATMLSQIPSVKAPFRRR